MTPRPPRPGPWFTVALIAAILGAWSAFVATAPPAVPPREEVAKISESLLKAGGLWDKISEERRGEMTDAMMSVLEQRVLLAKGSRVVRTAVALLLCAAYSWAMMAALRGFARLPHSSLMLGRAATLVIPLQVAQCAVDYALNEQLQPVMVQAFERISALSEAAGVVSSLTASQLARAQLWPSLITGGLMCTLFYLVRRYCFRRDVRALFPARPTPDDQQRL